MRGAAFQRNKAHSIENDGLFIDRGITENPPCSSGSIDTCGDAPDNTGYNPREFTYDDIPSVRLRRTSAQRENRETSLYSHLCGTDARAGHSVQCEPD
jgi:hypothetical protein